MPGVRGDRTLNYRNVIIFELALLVHGTDRLGCEYFVVCEHVIDAGQLVGRGDDSLFRRAAGAARSVEGAEDRVGSGTGLGSLIGVLRVRAMTCGHQCRGHAQSRTRLQYGGRCLQCRGGLRFWLRYYSCSAVVSERGFLRARVIARSCGVAADGAR